MISQIILQILYKFAEPDKNPDCSCRVLVLHIHGFGLVRVLVRFGSVQNVGSSSVQFLFLIVSIVVPCTTGDLFDVENIVTLKSGLEVTEGHRK